MIPMPRPSEIEPPPLPAGAAVGSFVLARVQSRDEFSIRYVATASASGGEVLIEEYAPTGLSLRDANGVLRPRSPAHTALWEEGLQAFVQESELLAKPLHPALIRVACLWQVRGTAFRMWPHFEGSTLTEVCASMTEPPTEEWLRGLVAPLLDALETLHEGGWVHGNVCPGQILMLPHGGPTLLDTGAARTAMGARLLPPAAWPEPGFRPPELAEPASGHAPGPWSDLYSLAAVARFCMGAPHAALGVAQMPGALSIGRYDSRFVSAFERALANDPQERPQTVAMFRQQLQAEIVPVEVATVATLPGAASPRRPAAWEVEVPPMLAPDPDPEPLGPGAAPIGVERDPRFQRAWLEPVHADPLWARAATRTPAARRWPWAFAGVLAVLAGAALAAYQLTRDDAPPFAGRSAISVPSAEQLLERDPTAAGPVANAAPEPRPELEQTVPSPAAAPTPLPPLPPTVADVVQPPPAAVRSERAPPPAAPAALPSRARGTPVERRAAVADPPAAMCAPRTNFALYRCMQVQCQQSRYQTHPQCVRLRQNDELPM